MFLLNISCRPSQSQQLLLLKSHSKYRHFLWAFWCVECLATLCNTFYSNCRPSQSQQLLLLKSHSKYRHFLWAFWCVECLATLCNTFYSNRAGERIARPTLRPSNWSPSPLPSSVSESIQNISIIYCTVTQFCSTAGEEIYPLPTQHSHFIPDP